MDVNHYHHYLIFQNGILINMKNMFSWCESLSSLPDISKWNTNNVNNMSYMFDGCESLSSLV